MPCLNEADTLGVCLDKAFKSLATLGVVGEVIVADNGSSDESIQIALGKGARVVEVAEKGYGVALMSGIEAAKGRYVLMGDADDSYDFGSIGSFIEKLREGHDLVMGCRLPAGGGRVLPGAMPRLHRWIGNPMFTWLVRWWFKAEIHDVYCGLRGFTKALYQDLNLRSCGMEFATEMVIKSSLCGARVTETPITLHPDGRRHTTPHLRTFRDGWRTLRFFLVYSPRRLFLYPSLCLVLFGLLGYGIAMPALSIGPATFDVHTLLFASLALILGMQTFYIAIFAKYFAVTEGLHPPDQRILRFGQAPVLNRGLLVGVISVFLGLALLGEAVWGWYRLGFGHLEYATTLRQVLPGVTLTALGFQTVSASFFLGVLGLKRR